MRGVDDMCDIREVERAEGYADGYVEGFIIGYAEGKAEMFRNMRADGISFEAALRYVGFDNDIYTRLMSKLCSKDMT